MRLKPPKKSLIKKYFAELGDIEDKYFANVSMLEGQMKEETGIDGIEFFWVDGYVVGIGTEDRKLPLIHRIGRGIK